MCSKIPVLPNFEQNISFLLYPIFNTRHQEVKFQKNLKRFTENFEFVHFTNSPTIHPPQMPHFGQGFFSKIQNSHFNDNLMSSGMIPARKNWCRKFFFFWKMKIWGPKMTYFFIEITLRHGCSSVNLLHIFRIPFYQNASAGLLLKNHGDGGTLLSWCGEYL